MRRLLFVLAAVVFFALAAAPAVVVFGLGWLVVFPASQGSHATGSSPEAWMVFVLFYLVWLVGLMLLLIMVNNRLGYYWHAWDRKPRPEKKKRRRLAAGMSFLEGQEDARKEVRPRPAAGSRASRDEAAPAPEAPAPEAPEGPQPPASPAGMDETDDTGRPA